MEVLHLVGTDEQKQRWLDPLLAGEIRSGFAMTEPDVASSDARNIATSIVRDGDDYVINGRKWWTTGAADPRCAVLIVMGRTDPDAERAPAAVDGARADGHPGRELVRSLPVFGYHDQHGHGEIVLRRRARAGRRTCSAARATASRSPRPGSGPGRVHHCMRLIGMAERALRLMVERARGRGSRSAGRSPSRAWSQRQIAEARMAIEQARLLVLKTAWLIDTVGRDRRPRPRSPPSRWSCRGWPARSSTTPSRCTAVPASATTSRWPRCTPGRAPCASPTAPTRCTSARWPAPS